MWFRPVIVVISCALLFQSVVARHSKPPMAPQQVVSNIKIVTQVSGDLNTALSSIKLTTSIPNIVLVAGKLAQGFASIVTDVAAAVTMMNHTPPFGDEDATLVVAALLEFVKVHQILLATVIGKHSIFAQFGLTAPIAAVLRLLEGGVDTFAISMITLIPSKKQAVQVAISGLDVSVKKCIVDYSQICIPSPTFLTGGMPICIA